MVLDELHNLKVSTNKIGILLADVEVYGIRIYNGFVKPSPHIIVDLGKIMGVMFSKKTMQDSILLHRQQQEEFTTPISFGDAEYIFSSLFISRKHVQKVIFFEVIDGAVSVR